MVEFLAIGRHAVRRADVAANQRVLVVGAGPIGLGRALFSKLEGAQVTAIDTRPDRLEFCWLVLGLPHALAPGDDLAAALAKITNGEMFDVVFDATGNRAAMEHGFRYVAHGGAYVLVSIVQGDITFNDPEFHKRETTLLASRNATIADFRDVIEAMRQGRVPLSALNTHRSTLEALPESLPQWLLPEAGVIKAIVEILDVRRSPDRHCLAPHAAGERHRHDAVRANPASIGASERAVSADALVPPAREAWIEALPIGNGRLGAMVFGGVAQERLQLNEDTLWAGGPYDPSQPRALARCPKCAG